MYVYNCIKILSDECVSTKLGVTVNHGVGFISITFLTACTCIIIYIYICDLSPKRGLMDFMVNREINFTVTAREFTISLREIEISR